MSEHLHLSNPQIPFEPPPSTPEPDAPFMPPSGPGIGPDLPDRPEPDPEVPDNRETDA